MANRTVELLAELAGATDEQHRIRVLTELQAVRAAHHALIFALRDMEVCSG
jgi:hypothetical protein